MTNITDYGAFVELEPGIEGLIHVSEMSWTKKNVHPGKIVSTSQEVEVQVLEVDSSKRRISLGLKQTLQNPWEAFAEKHPVGSTVEGEVKNKTEFGLFVGLDGDVDGMVHLSDLDWTGRASRRSRTSRRATRSAPRCSTSTWRRSASRSASSSSRATPSPPRRPGEDAGEGELRKGSVVTCEVLEVKDGGIEVKIAGTDLTAFIKRNELARDRGDQRPERFSVGEKVDARVTQFDRRARKIAVSIKALEVAEEKEAIAQYGSADSALRSATSSAPRSRPATRRSSRRLRRRLRKARAAARAFFILPGRDGCRGAANVHSIAFTRGTGLVNASHATGLPSQWVRHDRGNAAARLRGSYRTPAGRTRRAAARRADEFRRRRYGRLRRARLAHPADRRTRASRRRADLRLRRK